MLQESLRDRSRSPIISEKDEFPPLFTTTTASSQLPGSISTSLCTSSENNDIKSDVSSCFLFQPVSGNRLNNDTMTVEEMQKLFRPEFCEICKLRLSPMSTHYTEKAHNKKVRFWQAENKKAQMGADDIPLYCKYCDKEFSSIVVAMQHYDGKKHKSAVINGIKYGMVNPITGVLPKSVTTYEDPLLLGVGVGLARKLNVTRFHCETCHVQCPNLTALEEHYQGAKHRKKCPVQGVTDSPINGDNTNGQSEQMDNKYGGGPGNLFRRILTVDLKCSPCQTTCPDIVALVEHLRTENHNKKVYQGMQ